MSLPLPAPANTLQSSKRFNKKTVLWLNAEQCHSLTKQYKTPLIVYDERTLLKTTDELLKLPHAYGLNARYAVKANINSTLITFLKHRGLHFDASSHWEVERLLRYGVPGAQILLTAQEQAPHPAALLKKNVLLNATSLQQFHTYAAAIRNHHKNPTQPQTISIRINPGTTSSARYKTNVTGVDSSFGIWHEEIPTVLQYANHYGVRIERLHIHLSSNTHPGEWLALIEEVIACIVPQLETVSILNVGGGFAVARYPGEAHTQLPSVFRELKKLIIRFAKHHGRKLRVELEPGTYLIATAGILISQIDDITTTPSTANSHKPLTPNPPRSHKSRAHTHSVFVKVNTGMNDLMRPALYGAEHYMVAVSQIPVLNPTNTHPASSPPVGTSVVVNRDTPVIVVGHCCEKGDLLTPEANNPHAAQPRVLGKLRIGDYILITGVGAYGQALANHYNSFPHLAECWLDMKQNSHLIRKRQTLSDLVRSEINIFENKR